MKKKIQFMLLGIAILLVMAMSGCGVNQKTPEGVVESLIKEYVAGDEKNVTKCYTSQSDISELLQKEIDATLQYFAAHNPTKLKIDKSEKLSQNGDYTCVYIRYDLVLENEQEYPCLGTYMVKKQDGKYYVVQPSEVTDDLRTQAAADYTKFMTTDTYKSYTKAYNVFLKKNPGYEEKIANKLKAD